MKRDVLRGLNHARRNGRAVVRAVALDNGDEQMICVPDDSSMLAAEATRAARADQSVSVDVAGQTWFLTVYNPPLDLAIVGAVHIAQPLSAMAALAGYHVRMIDPRGAFATAERFPGLKISHDWPDDALTKAPLTPRSALVALSHDPKIDDPALTAALKSDCFYIGALGSKKTHAARRLRLMQQNLSHAELDRIHGPVGLAIGARSPAEIAIAILAEMTTRLRLGAATSNT
ncbi:MAG: XdhC family protein [Alphaproteobacteria bacterium]